MRHSVHLGLRLVVATTFLAVAPNAFGASDGDQSERRILVTFANADARKANVLFAPGRQYRHRARYAIAARARRDAKAVAKDFRLSVLEDWPIKAISVYCVVYKTPTDGDFDALLAKLATDKRVESAQAMNEFQTLIESSTAFNDAYTGLQHALVQMGVPHAHRYARGRGVTIAIIDSGVDQGHEELADAIVLNRRFVGSDNPAADTNHGTAVASVILAAANNRKGIVGVAPEARLQVLEACWAGEKASPAICNSFTLARALDHALKTPPDILNMSLAGPDDPLVRRMIAAAIEKGIIVVAAAANSPAVSGSFPARVEGVIGVEASETYKLRNASLLASEFLMAPGEHILVALPNDQYDFRSGNSLAAAHVSGAIALILEHAPEVTSDRIYDELRRSQEGATRTTGINVCSVLTKLRRATRCE